jgi:hypothetical protein
VPHRGADIAYWAGLPANLLDRALVGFGGNTSFLNALKRASPTWRDISIQFVERAAPPLKIRTFFETERLGNILVRSSQLDLTLLIIMQVVDKDSARLYLPNERFTGVANSNHKTMCKFDVADSQRYSPVWNAVRDMETWLKKPSLCVCRLFSVNYVQNFGRYLELEGLSSIIKFMDEVNSCIPY